MLYKIVFKSLTNRFRLVMDDVIGVLQSAFIPCRLITSNVFAALKLDMSKTYDTVECSFFTGMMVRLGFAARWVDFIMRCV